jgi:hypothetical protein
MNANRPSMSDRAGVALAAAAIVVTFAGALAITHLRNHSDPGRHANAAVAGRGVEVTTALYTTQSGQAIYVIADVSIVNNGDKAVAYIGMACSDPVTVEFRSTTPDPAGPPYSSSAAALRARIMQSRRNLDGPLEFTDEAPPKAAGKTAVCDESAPPILPPHQPFAYRQRAELVLGGTVWVDAPTTDVVATLELGDVPASTAPPLPIVRTDTIEVRTPLRQVASYTRASRAELAVTSQRFDELMKDPAASAWIGAQEPSSWGEAELRESFQSGSEWTMKAFNRGYALPLVATASGKTVVVRIPHERASSPVESEPVIPTGAFMRSANYVPLRDLYVGDLVLPSGRVMVGDPAESYNMLTFDLGLQPGKYPVHVVTARPRYLGDDWARVAWETLTLSKRPVTHWQPAIPVGHSAKELKPGDVFVWGTDGGTAGFGSPEAVKVIDAAAGVDQPLVDELFDRERANDYEWALLTVDSHSGANAFACESGFGDGGYPVFVGLDDQGRPAMLLSDFSVLDMEYGGIRAQ